MNKISELKIKWGEIDTFNVVYSCIGYFNEYKFSINKANTILDTTISIFDTKNRECLKLKNFTNIFDVNHIKQYCQNWLAKRARY